MMEVLEKIKKNYSDEDGELLLSAYKYAEEMHSGQKRASGEPYFTHPCAVAEILIDLGLDTPTVSFRTDVLVVLSTLRGVIKKADIDNDSSSRFTTELFNGKN